MSDPQKKDVYILPNLFTASNLLCGLLAISKIIDGDYLFASIAIIVAGIFDALDGRIARLTGQTSKFGTEFDSMCDLVSFGVAPALLVKLWALQAFGIYGWLATYVYLIATAFRLARYNTNDSQCLTNNFVGLPCPAAAYMVASTFIVFYFLNLGFQHLNSIVLGLILFLSYLMVSTHNYYSFKKTEILGQNSIQKFFRVCLLIGFIAIKPQIIFFFIVASYIVSGPTIAAFQMARRLK